MKLTKTVEYDPVSDDWVLSFTEEELEELGWEENDILLWIDNEDGSFTLRKK